MAQDIKQLSIAAIMLIALAAIVLTGIAVVDQYGQSLKTSATITDEAVTISSGAATLAFDELSAFTTFRNGTNVFISGNVTVDNRVNVTLSSGAVVTSLNDGAYNATYTYLADSDVTTSANAFSTGLAIFGAFVGVLAISLIGKVIVNLFKKE